MIRAVTVAVSWVGVKVWIDSRKAAASLWGNAGNRAVLGEKATTARTCVAWQAVDDVDVGRCLDQLAPGAVEVDWRHA